jgi:hypothetical protein
MAEGVTTPHPAFGHPLPAARGEGLCNRCNRRPDEGLRFVLLLLIALLVACTPRVDRERWQHMSPKEKDLYVRSLLGAEKVKERKGGNARTFPLSAEEYIRKIDEAYARGETRRVEVVFEEMGQRSNRSVSSIRSISSPRGLTQAN